MDQIEEMERAIMYALIQRKLGIDFVYLSQISNLSVKSRVFTGKGFYTNCTLDMELLREEDRALEISSEIINSSAFNSLNVGFVLFIRHGAVAMLEGYTFDGSEWPKERLAMLRWENDLEGKID